MCAKKIKKPVKVKEEIKDAIKNGKLIIGSNSVIKNIKNGKLKIVIHASNCPIKTKKYLSYYSNLSDIEVKEIKENSKILGEFCGKPFNILMIGIKK